MNAKPEMQALLVPETISSRAVYSSFDIVRPGGGAMLRDIDAQAAARDNEVIRRRGRLAQPPLPLHLLV